MLLEPVMEGLVALPQMAGELLFTLPVGEPGVKQVGLPLVRAVSKATCGPKVSSVLSWRIKVSRGANNCGSQASSGASSPRPGSDCQPAMRR